MRWVKVTCGVCACSWRPEVDRAVGGRAEDVRDEAAGRAGGDRPGQAAEGGAGHPLPGSGCVHPHRPDGTDVSCRLTRVCVRVCACASLHQVCLTSVTQRWTSSTGPDTMSSSSTTWKSSRRCWSFSTWRSSEWSSLLFEKSWHTTCRSLMGKSVSVWRNERTNRHTGMFL